MKIIKLLSVTILSIVVAISLYYWASTLSFRAISNHCVKDENGKFLTVEAFDQCVQNMNWLDTFRYGWR